MPRTYSYKLQHPATDWHHTVAFRWIRRTGKHHLHLAVIRRWFNPCRRLLYWAEIQRSKEVWRREEKKRHRRKERPIDYFTPVLSSETLWTHFLRFRVSDLNFYLSPLPNLYSIRPAIQYRTHSSYLVITLGRDQGGRVSAHDLPWMGASAGSNVLSHW
jgi:hypothetical protein